MAEPRPYRHGLGLPPGLVITSGPAPSKPQRDRFEAAQLGLAEEEYAPTSQDEWKEWNINPARHGPEKLTRLPTFVKGLGNYDELGRTSAEGSGVEVDEGRRAKDALKARDGQTAEWYRGLASQAASSSTKSQDREIKVHTVIDLSMEDDDDQPLADAKPALDSPGPIGVSPRVAQIEKPIRVKRSEWFIRRALAARERFDPTSTHSSPGPSSIGNMLKIEAAQPRIAPSHYVLGPENKGYELLRSRHGWEGGGLGRPQGWAGRASSETPPRTQDDIPLDVNGKPIVDLTTDSEPEEDFDDVPAMSADGPGRTAPVATSLKLDRLGLGHRRNAKAAADAEKKVTHTIEEIRRVQQRSRYPPPKEGLSLGKKGKIKWKDQDKKEREERKRMLAMLNS